jgi:hypothetical protein
MPLAFLKAIRREMMPAASAPVAETAFRERRVPTTEGLERGRQRVREAAPEATVGKPAAVAKAVAVAAVVAVAVAVAAQTPAREALERLVGLEAPPGLVGARGHRWVGAVAGHRAVTAPWMTLRSVTTGTPRTVITAVLTA